MSAGEPTGRTDQRTYGGAPTAEELQRWRNALTHPKFLTSHEDDSGRSPLTKGVTLRLLDAASEVERLTAALTNLLDALEDVDPAVLGIEACAAYDFAAAVLAGNRAALAGADPREAEG